MPTIEQIPDYGDTVVDAAGLSHVVESLFTSEVSGYGWIFSTTQPHTLIKIFKDIDDAPGVMRRLRELPLENLNLVRPTAELLPPYGGYVMRAALAGSQWFTVAPARAGIWLQTLARVTEIVARLHARSLVFGDLNPKNVLVSPDGRDALLIDLDTIVREGVRFGADYQMGRWTSLRAPDFDSERAWARQDVWAIAAVAKSQAEKAAEGLASLLPRTCPMLYDPSGTVRAPRDLPSALALWRSIAADADQLLSCWQCERATQLDWCPDCGSHLSEAELAVEGPHGVSTLRLNSASGSVLLRRHVLGGPHRSADAEYASISVVASGLRLAGRDFNADVPFDGERSAQIDRAPVRLRARRLDRP